VGQCKVKIAMTSLFVMQDNTYVIKKKQKKKKNRQVL